MLFVWPPSGHQNIIYTKAKMFQRSDQGTMLQVGSPGKKSPFNDCMNGHRVWFGRTKDLLASHRTSWGILPQTPVFSLRSARCHR
jgi:hypothetical protein